MKIVFADLNNGSGETHYPLTVLSWQRENEAVVGRVRNDNGQTLRQARVVVLAPACAWQEASLTITELEPGQETDFRLDTFYCAEGDVSVVGQGVVAK